VTSGPFPDDDLRRALQRLVRLGSLLEPHSKHHAGLHMSLSEMMALGELADVDSMSQQELGQLLGLEKSTVSRLVAGLQSRGWVETQRDPTNRRFSRLQLTPEGRELADRIGEDLRAHHQQLLAALTPDERAALTVGLTGLARALASNPPHRQVSQVAGGDAQPGSAAKRRPGAP
jgi:DNA-binding MarR family transcriptional regulator